MELEDCGLTTICVCLGVNSSKMSSRTCSWESQHNIEEAGSLKENMSLPDRILFNKTVGWFWKWSLRYVTREQGQGSSTGDSYFDENNELCPWLFG